MRHQCAAPTRRARVFFVYTAARQRNGAARHTPAIRAMVIRVLAALGHVGFARARMKHTPCRARTKEPAKVSASSASTAG